MNTLSAETMRESTALTRLTSIKGVFGLYPERSGHSNLKEIFVAFFRHTN